MMRYAMHCDDCNSTSESDWHSKITSDAEWHNTMTGHDVAIVSYIMSDDGDVELLTDDGWIAVTHRWQRGRFTGTRTCEACGLLPLDRDDIASVCEGKRD